MEALQLCWHAYIRGHGGQCGALRVKTVWFFSRTSISCDPLFRHVFIITTNRSMCSSLLCNMPDGGDQKIGHRGEHMCLAHYPSSSPSSTRHTRLHMLTTGGHFHTSGNLSHSGRHVCQSVASSCLASCLILNFNNFVPQFNWFLKCVSQSFKHRSFHQILVEFKIYVYFICFQGVGYLQECKGTHRLWV